MAAVPIPAALKSADISRFALRGSQLEKVEPVIFYWCDYFIVNRILAKGLHTENDECMAYTTHLMDRLERIKAEQANNDAILDDVVAQAYVEQFALKVFQRGDNAMRSNKSTHQTADTLQAAATFLDLLAIWQNPLDTEVSKKVKFAKVHALRIAKALKAGEDPNLTNPVEEPVSDAQALDPNDPEVQHIQGLQPTVEDVTGLPSSNGGVFAPQQEQGDVSPLDAPPASSEYFPNMPPTFTAPSQPIVPAANAPSISPPVATAGPMFGAASPFHAQRPTALQSPAAPTPAMRPPSHPQMPAVISPVIENRAPVPAPFSPPVSYPAPALSAAAPYTTSNGELKRDDESMLKAQKHAKWAISALNFDDVDTAVRELRNALSTLGV